MKLIKLRTGKLGFGLVTLDTTQLQSPYVISCHLKWVVADDDKDCKLPRFFAASNRSIISVKEYRTELVYLQPRHDNKPVFMISLPDNQDANTIVRAEVVLCIYHFSAASGEMKAVIA